MTWRAILLGVLCLSPTAARADEIVLRVGTLTEMEPLSPMATSGFWYGSAWTGLVHQPLLTLDSDGRLAPCLARRWEVSQDNRSITFHLPPEARWHDGEPLTAADAAFTLDYIRQHQLIGQIWRFYEGSHVLDDTTLVVRFNRSVAYYQSLMFAVPPVLPRHIWQEVEEPRRFAGAEALVGSGVFAFHAWDADARVAYLRRSDGPAVPRPPIERVEIRFFSSPGALILSLRRGEIDLLMGAQRHVPPAFLDAITSEPGVATLEMESAAVPLTLVFHGTRAPTRELAFREAVALAIDVKLIIQTVLRGHGRVAGRGFVPPANWTYGGPFPPLVQDVARSRILLDSLGFVDRDGDGLREDPEGAPFHLPLIPETWQSTGEAVRAAEVLVHQLRQVGLSASVDKHVVDREYELLWDERDYLAYVGHTTPTSTRDGGHVYFADYAGFSYGTFTDSAYHVLIDRITGSPDEAAYLSAVRDAQAWNDRHLPGIALAWGTRVYAWRDDRFTGWSPVVGDGLPSYLSWSTVRPLSPAEPTGDTDSGAAGRLLVWGSLGLAAVVAARALWQRRRRTG